MERRRKICITVFVLYCLLMLWLMLHRDLPDLQDSYLRLILSRLNLQPLHTIRNYLRIIYRRNMTHYLRAVVNLGGNILMFVPLGFFLPELFPQLRRFPAAMGVTLAAILTVEVLQLATLRGSFDIDDLLLNLPGAALGYALQRMWANRHQI